MFNGGEDAGGGIGPNEGLGGWVVVVDEGAHIDFELAGRSGRDPVQLLARQCGEAALDLMDPRRQRRGETEMSVRMPSQPASHVQGLAAGVVVHDDVDAKIVRDGAAGALEEVKELPGPLVQVAGTGGRVAGGDVWP